MKNWIFFIIACVFGFVVHQIYTNLPQDTPPAELSTHETLPPIPQQCEEEGDILEDAIYSHEMGKFTTVELDRYTRRFQSCLRDAGLTDSQINRTHAGIKEAAQKELAQVEQDK